MIRVNDPILPDHLPIATPQFHVIGLDAHTRRQTEKKSLGSVKRTSSACQSQA
jgi:hypothetical protein